SQYNTDSGLEDESAQLRDQIRHLFTAIREKSGHDSQDELLSVEQIDQLMADSEHQAFTCFETASRLVGPEILERYLTESIELIETIEKGLLELERNPGQTDIMKDIFRNVHSLKGDSGFMGFADVESICMQIESLIDNIMNHSIACTSDLISILLFDYDLIRNKLSSIDTRQPKPDTSIGQAPQIIEQLKLINAHDIYSPSTAATAPPPPPASCTAGLPPVQDTKPSQPVIIDRKEIRVDTQKLDKLFNLVGELITAEVMVTNHPELSGLDLPNFSKAGSMLTKITRELQEVTMSIRMTPLEGLFNKMKRLVRDLSKKSNKTITLSISGQETEMDKTIIEDISDPLVHILRNSIDHGIELPAERTRRNKPIAGMISLKAEYEGNEILIVIQDDGAGLNRDKILRKAIERNLIKENPDKLPDQEVWRIIFEPGFSTADKITEISGRGVGMDVVKKNIEKLHGKIDIESQPGQGTTFKLRIPLTLAIMDVMVVKVGHHRYAIPMLSICESFKAGAGSITVTMDGQEIVKVRDEIIPVIRLHELFNTHQPPSAIVQGILMIIESRGEKACLLVDDILGQQQTVIKGLSDYIGRIPSVSGCMILSDGEIGLIIDIEGIFKQIIQA
nr:chemotaxis protein CheA [Candidatus Delongbacteria bacterium]